MDEPPKRPNGEQNIGVAEVRQKGGGVALGAARLHGRRAGPQLKPLILIFINEKEFFAVSDTYFKLNLTNTTFSSIAAPPSSNWRILLRQNALQFGIPPPPPPVCETSVKQAGFAIILLQIKKRIFLMFIFFNLYLLSNVHCCNSPNKRFLLLFTFVVMS